MIKKLLNSIDLHNLSFISHFWWLKNDVVLTNKQNEFINLLKNNRFVILKKGRQVGATSITCGHIVEKINENDNFNVLIVCSNNSLCKYLWNIIRDYCLRINNQSKFIEHNINKITLYNNSTIIFRHQNNIHQLCGFNLDKFDLIYLDEYGFFENQENCYNFCMRILKCTGQMVIVSTPNEKSDYFYHLYEHNNMYVKYTIPYNDIPKNDIEFPNDIYFRNEILGEFM